MTSCIKAATYLLLVAGSSNAQQVRRTQTTGSVHVTGACTYDNVLTAYNVAFNGNGLAELTSQLGNPGDVASAVASKCAGVSAGAAIEFGEVTSKGVQHDFNYFSGGSSWNDGGTEKLSVDAARAERFLNVSAKNRPVAFPDHLSMFDTCNLRAITCCFVAKRSDAAGPDHTIPDDPESNADICTIDNTLNQDVSHVTAGVGIYNAKDTDSAYCSGFSWSSDTNSVSSKFAANTLFYVSMVDALWNKNYVKNAPGMPMCGCVEKMPVISNAACTEAVEGYAFTFSGNTLTVTYEVSFEDCGDLISHYESSDASTAEIANFKKQVVGDGNCEKAQDDFIAEKFQMQRGAAPNPFNVDLTKWEPVYGRGLLEYPHKTNEEFLALLAASPNKIVRRLCKSCYQSHRDIYYQRITDAPAEFLSYFLTDWKSENNVMGTDFNLYSSYQAALDEDEYEKWRYCNYDYATIGFPRDCGHFGYSSCNWNSVEKTWCYAYDVAFFVEKA